MCSPRRERDKDLNHALFLIIEFSGEKSIMTVAQPTATTAVRTNDFVSTLGVNTHIDFANYGYQNLATVEANINYLGVKNLRDSAQTPTDAQTWLQVAQATGAKFDDYIAETSPAGMTTDLSYVKQLASEGLLNFVEGGNEEDDDYPASLGNTMQITAQFQQQVYATGHALGLPVINMSFGSGWTAANNYQGDYGAVGNLAAYADYSNAHSYPNVGQGTDWSTQRLNGLAHLADSTDPVITTEIGWNESQGFGQANIAKYVVQAALDGMKEGDAKTYFYGLYDDGSGLFGLMNQDGTAKPAGTALHNLTSLLADTGATANTFTAGTLSYTLAGSTANDNALLMEKSDGTYWLSLWNEDDAAHTVTLTLGGAATEIKVFNPVTGVTAVQDVKGVASTTLSISDSPSIVEVIGAGVVASPSPTSAPPPPAPATTPSDLAVVVPAHETVTAGTKLAVTGVSINDVWAASTPGVMTLNISDSGGGTVAIAGKTATSSGGITLTGSLSQLNASLAGLTYTAGASGTDSITIDAWNQGGVEALKTIGVTVTGATTPPPAPPPPPPPATTTVTIASADADPVVVDSSVIIKATAGNHMLFIGGTHDVAVLTGGTEQVQAYQGYNTITTGAGNDTIKIAGTGNVVNAGAGTNTINDSGTGNTLVMPGAGAGMDQIYGYVMTNNDKFDFTTSLKGTAWTGTSSTVGQFLHVATSGNDAIVSVSPVANGAASKVADFHDSGAVSMSSLLAHSIL
jgi:serralysin